MKSSKRLNGNFNNKITSGSFDEEPGYDDDIYYDENFYQDNAEEAIADLDESMRIYNEKKLLNKKIS